METRSKLKSQNESHPPSIQPPSSKQKNEQTTEDSLDYITRAENDDDAKIR